MAEATCRFISQDAGIPRDWLAAYVEFDIVENNYRLRIDCMNVTLSTRFEINPFRRPGIDKLYNDVQVFIMLLWGEPCCLSN